MGEKLFLPTMRASEKVEMTDFPAGLRAALVNFDHIRSCYGYEAADVSEPRCPAIKRLRLGLRRLTLRGVTRIAVKHGGVCPVYCRGAVGTLTSLSGLFWWNGSPEVRRRLLMLAWRKGGDSGRRALEEGEAR